MISTKMTKAIIKQITCDWHRSSFKKLIGILFYLFLYSNLEAQFKYDSLISVSGVSRKAMVYSYGDQLHLYTRPKPFSFITQIPKTFQASAKMVFQKKNITALSVIAGSTLLLVSFDQKITDGVRSLSRSIHLNPERNYKTLVSFNLGSTPVNVYDLPQNFNSVLYSIGEGSTSVLISGGLFLYGKASKDHRALSTASQIIQAQLVMGITTQLIKRISGRESPFNSTTPGGAWRPLTSPSVYQKNVSHYDAFPSGHLGTMMATTVVLLDNYPEKKWLKPVAYSLIGLVGFAMINNEVHWAGDYPLAIGLGYLAGKATVKLNRLVVKK